MSEQITCFEEWRELSMQRQWELYQEAKKLADLFPRTAVTQYDSVTKMLVDGLTHEQLKEQYIDSQEMITLLRQALTELRQALTEAKAKVLEWQRHDPKKPANNGGQFLVAAPLRGGKYDLAIIATPDEALWFYDLYDIAWIVPLDKVPMPPVENREGT